MKKFLFVLLFAVAAFGQTAKIAQQGLDNYVGYADTAILMIGGDGTARYSSLFNLTDFEHVRLIAMADDTSSAALGSDSIKFAWGYQTGSVVLNANGSRDTVWDAVSAVRVDTMNSASVNPSFSTMDSTGTITQAWGKADTNCVTGFFVQSRNFPIHWDEYLRIWAIGIDGKNNEDREVKAVFAVKRRLSDNVRIKY